MNAPRRSNSRSWGLRSFGARAGCAFVLVLACACRSPLGGRELDLAFSARGVPGVGAGLAVGQRLFDAGPRRVDFEAGLERQRMADEGPSGDDWTRAWVGLRSAPVEPGSHLDGRAGFTWLRSEGRTAALGGPGDHGGAYLGAGWLWEPSGSFATGPELTLLYVDAEGSQSGSGALLELAWRFVWRL